MIVGELIRRLQTYPPTWEVFLVVPRFYDDGDGHVDQIDKWEDPEIVETNGSIIIQRRGK